MASSRKSLYIMLTGFFIIFFVMAEGRGFPPTVPTSTGLAENSQPTAMKPGEVFELKPKIHPSGGSTHSDCHHGPECRGLAENSQPTTMKSGEVFELKPKIHPSDGSTHSGCHHGPGWGNGPCPPPLRRMPWLGGEFAANYNEVRRSIRAETQNTSIGWVDALGLPPRAGLGQRAMPAAIKKVQIIIIVR
ncbi:hypothetical protein M5K25_023318 [Dendrobium thyrsiflorum]|uniref:Uncharacterized protein n=1 Tax=Dendrobium thyrsiflorum TaxID=117978 RepID=A0ABD0U8G4_DENTH